MDELTTRDKIIMVLDDENAWEHVILHYIASVRKSSYLIKWRKNGLPDQRNNIGRLMLRLNDATGKYMLVMKHEKKVW